MSEDFFQEGDEFDVPPIQASRIISKILAAGGKFKLVGNIVRITEIKNKVAVSFPKTEEEKPEPEPEPEPVVEVVEVEEPKVVVEEPKVEEKKPVTRGRKPKATSTEERKQ